MDRAITAVNGSRGRRSHGHTTGGNHIVDAPIHDDACPCNGGRAHAHARGDLHHGDDGRGNPARGTHARSAKEFRDGHVANQLTQTVA